MPLVDVPDCPIVSVLVLPDCPIELPELPDCPMELPELPDCPLEPDWLESCAKAVIDADRISAHASVKSFFMKFGSPLAVSTNQRVAIFSSISNAIGNGLTNHGCFACSGFVQSRMPARQWPWLAYNQPLA